MKNSILFISEIPIWNIGGKTGIEIFSRTINGFSESGWQTQILCPKHNRYLKGINPRLVSIKYLGFLYRQFWVVYFLTFSILIGLGSKKSSVIYGAGHLGIISGKIIRLFRSGILVKRYFGLWSTYEKMDKPGFKIKKFLLLKSMRTKSPLTIITNDGTKGDEVFTKLKGRTDKLIFVPNGINKSAFLNNKNESLSSLSTMIPGTRLLIAVARLNNEKGISLLIESLSYVSFPNYRIMILGTGPMEGKLKEMAVRLNLDDKIEFMGQVSRKEIPKYYQAAEFFISLYPYSNAGNPLFEAMLSGNYIITFNNGTTSEFIPENGVMYIPLRDPKSVASVINQALNMSKKECFKRGMENSEHMVKHFSDWSGRIEMEVKEISSLGKMHVK